MPRSYHGGRHPFKNDSNGIIPLRRCFFNRIRRVIKRECRAGNQSSCSLNPSPYAASTDVIMTKALLSHSCAIRLMLKTSAFEHVQNRICLLLPVYAPLPSATVTPRSISSPMRLATLSPLEVTMISSLRESIPYISLSTIRLYPIVIIMPYRTAFMLP